MTGPDKVVQAEHLGLRYRLRSEEHQTLKWTILSWVRSAVERREFWALKDISFAIEAGQSWGIIGVNGSGKSTLLKLITGILRPDQGSLQIHGRVSALLELGAGFQPDLTGRENIYLNGALLGLSRAEIGDRVEDIITFSEIRPFIDTPVKHYSSGMYMRLGFAIASHIDPDILLIDEIFAVGDLTFQEKCMDRVHRFKAEGKTIVMVSHDLHAIRTMCEAAIWLDKGKIGQQGPAVQVIDSYLNSLKEQSDLSQPFAAEEHRWGTGTVRINEVQMYDSKGKQTNRFQSGGPFHCVLTYQTTETVENPVFGLAIHRADGVHICGPNTRLSNKPIASISGKGTVSYRLDRLPLLPGSYQLSAVVYNESCTVPYDHRERQFPFTVTGGGNREIFGVIELGGTWDIEKGRIDA
ncbi:ABC transporter ATP-binding protein [bacterium]|nr:ABC transporter ATP-binding protein [bacterium]